MEPPPCGPEHPCPDGQLCQADGACVDPPPCTENADCAEGEVCRSSGACEVFVPREEDFACTSGTPEVPQTCSQVDVQVFNDNLMVAEDECFGDEANPVFISTACQPGCVVVCLISSMGVQTHYYIDTPENREFATFVCGLQGGELQECD